MVKDEREKGERKQRGNMGGGNEKKNRIKEGGKCEWEMRRGMGEWTDVRHVARERGNDV